MNDALLRLSLLVISAITVVTGASQLAMPDRMLEMAGAVPNPASSHFFATVGMFMVITGAMFFQALWLRTGERVVATWIGVQKLAAALLVGWAIQKGLMGAISWAVAGFDFVTGLLVFVFLARRAQ